jgi:hypothetical protein
MTKPQLSDLGKLQHRHRTQKRTRKVPRKQQTGIICYQLPDVAYQLRIVAAEQNKTQQALLAEGLNVVFVKYGKPPIASQIPASARAGLTSPSRLKYATGNRLSEPADQRAFFRHAIAFSNVEWLEHPKRAGI